MKRHGLLAAGGALLRLLGAALRHWKLVLVALFFLSPTGPHLRMQYTYQDSPGPRVYLACTYLGSRGFISAHPPSGCPVIAILDARDWR